MGLERHRHHVLPIFGIICDIKLFLSKMTESGCLKNKKLVSVKKEKNRNQHVNLQEKGHQLKLSAKISFWFRLQLILQLLRYVLFANKTLQPTGVFSNTYICDGAKGNN